MKRVTIKQTPDIQTLDWVGSRLVDWYHPRLRVVEDRVEMDRCEILGWGDIACSSNDGTYAVLLKELGTKGLLLKNGEILREIDRSYEHSDVHSYPAAFFEYENRTYLAHCPRNACQLDFEDVESGEILTRTVARYKNDHYHSRLDVSPDNQYLLSNGWVWHPIEIVELFSVEECFKNPALLDQGLTPKNVSVEICSAAFINNNTILLCSSDFDHLSDAEDPGRIPANSLARWNFKEDFMSEPVTIDEPIGGVYPIDTETCWDTYGHPKIINLNTGVVVDRCTEIQSGERQGAMIGHLAGLPKIAFDRVSKQLAIYGGNTLEILSP